MGVIREEQSRRIVQMIILAFLLYFVAVGAERWRDDKQFSVFNVIRFPNDVCTSASSINGTCYTATECTSLGGASSGACASGFGVCCVFNLACGGSSSANNTYATVASFSTTTDTDPCTYTFCKTSDDVCKLRIDYDAMILSDPDTVSSATTATVADGLVVGDCNTDSLSIGVPGFSPTPIICGYNSGQHMWVPASDSCVTITIDIDTASTTTTRSWNIRVTQYECGNLNAPEQNCLQYHTAQIGTIASFNWDTTSTAVLTNALAMNNAHLSNQNYDICIRRIRGYCSVCFSPHIMSTANDQGASFGMSANNNPSAPTAQSAMGTLCNGKTSMNPDPTNAAHLGQGDYLEILNFQAAPGTDGALGANRICGSFFNSAAAATAHQTLCSFKTPFRVGVRFDVDEAIGDNSGNAHGLIENETSISGSGFGYTGFWLDFWQNTC